MTGTLNEVQYTLLFISRLILKMKNAVEKVVEKIKTRFIFSNFFFSEKRALYEITRRNVVEPNSPQMTIWRVGITCWIPKATDIHLKYVLLIAFPPQQRLHERASMLRYTYIACLVCSYLLTYVFDFVCSFLHYILNARLAHTDDTVCCGTPFEDC